jgi:dUTP pyrophosphatase
MMISSTQIPAIRNLYATQPDTAGNSGFDLYLPETTVFPAGMVTYANFGVQMMTSDGTGFFLLPRSSISKTPLRLANSVGLIDPTYRGNLIAALENTSSGDITIHAGTRLMQVCLPSLLPFHVEWVDYLPQTQRGAGGFGSTGA